MILLLNVWYTKISIYLLFRVKEHLTLKKLRFTNEVYNDPKWMVSQLQPKIPDNWAIPRECLTYKWKHHWVSCLVSYVILHLYLQQSS